MKKKSNIKRLMSGFVLVISVACLLPSGAVSSDVSSDQIENTRTALEKWVQTQSIISKEKRDFVLTGEMLKERFALYKREIESLRGKTSDARESIAEADRKRADLLEENEKLKEASTWLLTTVIKMEDNIKLLLQRLPDPIRERVKPLSQRLPEKNEQTKLSTAERFQNVVGILNEVDKFNHEISATSEVRTLSDGSCVEVAAIYIGIGQAYYTSANGKIAGVGTASEDGWVWKPFNEAAGKIAEAIAILKNEKVASFVPVPVEIK
ncbi:MAG TPA: DUF3450 family protein [Planctomycetes bacterium]|nr:DUF3450 family protein [Planctomycetota bacterium]